MIPRDKKLSPRAREMRNNATKQENCLWYEFLRKHEIHFYRQRIIGEYIVDFYCPKAKLVIEIDGPQHNESEAREYDAIRTAYMNAFGLQVLRFSNADVDQNFGFVCETIDSILSQLR